MKTLHKWFVPVLIILLLGTGSFNKSYALWPFGGKKDKDAQQTTVQDIQKPGGLDDKDKGDADSDEQPSKAVGGKKPAAAAPPGPPPQPAVQLQSPLNAELNNLKVEDPTEDVNLPPEKSFVAVDDPANPLGITVSAQKLNESAKLIEGQHYKEASTILNPLKEWLIDATEVHINLHKTLKGIPSAQVQAELEKQLALQFALLRDKAFFQLGMLAIAEKDYNEAIKNLSRVIQSQPRSPMGSKAYDVLQKIGFTEKIQIRETPKESTNN